MRGLPYRASETDIYNASRGRCSVQCFYYLFFCSLSCRCLFIWSFVALSPHSSSHRWIRCGSTSKWVRTAGWPARPTWSSPRTRMQSRPCPRTRPTCVSVPSTMAEYPGVIPFWVSWLRRDVVFKMRPCLVFQSTVMWSCSWTRHLEAATGPTAVRWWVRKDHKHHFYIKPFGFANLGQQRERERDLNSWLSSAIELFSQVTSPLTVEVKWALATLEDTVAKAAWEATTTTVSASCAMPGRWRTKTFTETATDSIAPLCGWASSCENDILCFFTFESSLILFLFFSPHPRGPAVHVPSLVR